VSEKRAVIVESSVGRPATQRPKLTALTSLRFFAALHIFIFHIAALPSAEEMEQFQKQMRETQATASDAEVRAESVIQGMAETDQAADATEAGHKTIEQTDSSELTNPPAQGTQAAAEQPAAVGPELTPNPNRGLYAALPSWLSLLIMRGYCSTGLFFMLSGFVLAYLYVDADGNQTVSNRDFWLARWIRIYPLHFLMLFLVLPGMFFILGMMPTPTLWKIPVSKPAFALLSGVMSLLLIQAWCPEAALTWNFATWALSAVVFFYAVFPWVVMRLKGLSRNALWFWFWMMPILNLIPSIVYLIAVDPKSSDFMFWTELVMRTPLFWLPHFVMAIILARLFQITRFDLKWTEAKGSGLWGDIAGLVILAILVTPDSVFQRLFGLGTKPPNFILRHGLMTPIYSVFLYNMALGRGWIARLLSFPLLERLGEASFGIFNLQGPMMFPAMLLFGRIPSPVIRVLLTAILVIVMALLSLRYIERPIAKRLKNRWNIATAA
jgi:peptidoglycan/LPS O-acetylase OafA/YrhL